MRRTYRVQSMFNDQEYGWLKDLAGRARMGISEYVRMLVREAAQRARLADRLMAQSAEGGDQNGT